MSFTKITNRVIEPGTITADLLAPGVGAGPAIANVQIANSSYLLIDDTGISTANGGYIIINGENFESNVQVLIGNTVATSVTYVSASQIRAQIPALSTGSKVVYLVNTDTGSTAIRVNGVTYSSDPTWVTDTSLTGQDVDVPISIQLSATSDSNVSYSLASGSSLPPGVSLAANGLLSGTVTTIENDTTYNFTIVATDQENQDSSKSFSVFLSARDEYFKYTTLLLSGDGTNGAQNNTFLDGSTNNFTITRNGNTTQGTFSPFSLAAEEWGNYFDGTGDTLSIGSASNWTFLHNGSSFTIEFWLYQIVTDRPVIATGYDSTLSHGFIIDSGSGAAGQLRYLFLNASGSVASFSSNTNVVPLNQWNYCAFTFDTSTKTGTWYVNGANVGTTTNSGFSYSATNPAYALTVGDRPAGAFSEYNGYISNLRISSVIRTGLTNVPTSPLTAITNTSLLTCQSNRFVDNSTNAFAITRNGNVRVTPFSPFAPSAAYDPAVNGGSGYFDGSGDILETPTSGQFAPTGDFTIGLWFYPNAALTTNQNILGNLTANVGTDWLIQMVSGTINFYTNGTTVRISSATAILPLQWNYISMTRSSNVISAHVNGASLGTYSQSGTFGSATKKLQIGNATNNVNGYVSGVILVDGSANTSVPTAPPTAISGTNLLLNFTNAGIFDNTGKNNLETVGDAQIDTTTKKYGTGSMEFDGTGDWLQLPRSPDLYFGAGNFTVECWVYPTASSSQPIIAGQWSGSTGSTTLSWVIILSNDANRNLRFALSTNGSGVLTDTVSSTPLPLNTWSHVALVRNGNVFTIYLNGVAATGGSYTISAGTALYDATNQISVGASSTGSQPFQGFIDDLRITKGVARYTANFTAPTKSHKLK